jgi:integrase
MRGHTYKRGSSWTVVYDEQPNENGKRRTAATLALTRGVPVHIVAARLGDDPKQILRTYSHLLPQSDQMAAVAVADALVSKS